MSAISGSLAAVGGANSAAKQRREDSRTRDMERRAWLESRGAGVGVHSKNYAGYQSSVLPFYFGKTGEADLAADVMARYKAGAIDPTAEYNSYQSVLDRMEPSFAAGERTVGDIFNGNLTEEKVNNLRPVFAARAGAAKDAGMEALNETLNQIKATQARKGFSGDSSATNRLNFEARRRIGGDVARVGVGNAAEEAAVRNAGVDLRINNLDAPYRLAKSRLDLASMPAEAVATASERRLRPFNFFRLNPSAAPARNISPAGPGGLQIASTAMGNVNSDLASAYFRSRSARYGTGGSFSGGGGGYGGDTVGAGGWTSPEASYVPSEYDYGDY